MMKVKLIFLLCLLAAMCSACAAESDNLIKIDIKQDNYQYDDKEIQYILTNKLKSEVAYSNFGYLERKTGDSWEAVPSTKPDSVAWCGTRALLKSGETQCAIPFLYHNGTLAAGSYRVVFYYTLSNDYTSYMVSSEGFTLTGDFPMSEGYPPPANIHLTFDSNAFPKNSPEINYKIINESGGDVFISPYITLMLYQDSEWKSFRYDTGVKNEITSSDKENIRIISAEKIPGGFDNCTKIRIIEQVAIPMRNVFYVFYEIDLV